MGDIVSEVKEVKAAAEARPLFSVVIPAYNRASSLKRAIGSICAQTCQDFEILVADDGSTDNTVAMIEELTDPRIRLLRLAHGGANAARNAGIDNARGRYVAFLDSDDVFLPHHLSSMKDLLKGREGHAGYARIIVDRGAGKRFMKPPRAIMLEESVANYLMSDRGFIQTSTLVVETRVARVVRYDESLSFGQDLDYAIRLGRAGCRFAMAEQPGVLWDDTENPNRISYGRKGAQLMDWLETQRPYIPSRAYRGYRGWAIAKSIAETSRMKALGLYLSAVAHGCYSPRLAAVVFLQIFLRDRSYRRIADRYVALVRRSRATVDVHRDEKTSYA